MRHPACPRVRAAKVRFVRFLFSTAGASHYRGEDRKVVGHFLSVHGKVIYTIKASGDVNEEDRGFHLSNVRVSLKRGRVEVRCGGMFALTTFHSMIAYLPQS